MNYIHESVVQGANVEIGHFNIIEENVQIGNDVQIGHHCFIAAGSVIGDGTKIANYVFVKPLSSIGKRCTIGSYCRTGGNKSIIGDDVMMKMRSTVSPGCIVGTGSFIGPHALMLHEDHRGHNPSHIMDDGYLAASAVILPGKVIGKHGVFGAGGVVTKTVAENTMVFNRTELVIKKIPQSPKR